MTTNEEKDKNREGTKTVVIIKKSNHLPIKNKWSMLKKNPQTRPQPQNIKIIIFLHDY